MELVSEIINGNEIGTRPTNDTRQRLPPPARRVDRLVQGVPALQ